MDPQPHPPPPAPPSTPAAALPAPMDLAPLCAETALTLLQHGAESALVESLARRAGLALGADHVEIALVANAVTVTVRIRGRSKTTVRRNADRGINMHTLQAVQHLVLEAEARRLAPAAYREALLALQPFRYPDWQVVVGVAAACAAFARLNHADAAGCALAGVASGAAMAVRQRLARAHFNPLIVFFVTAFVATSLAAACLALGLDRGGPPKAAMAASVLALVPGYALINSVADMVKGYLNVGMARGLFGLLLAAATTAGIVAAMSLWGAWGWLA